MTALAVITHNRVVVLSDTLAAVARHTAGDTRILVADDGSTDGTLLLLAGQGVPVVTGGHRGAAWNRNRALYWAFERAGADVLLMLDDDVQPVEEGWEAPWLEAAAQVGLVFFGYHLPANTREPMLTCENGGGCMALTREMFEQLGYFDPAYCGGWAFEDADYARRWRRLVGSESDEWRLLFSALDAWGLNCGIRHLAAGSHYNADAYERNRAIYEADADLSVFRLPWRSHAERMEFLGEQA